MQATISVIGCAIVVSATGRYSPKSAIQPDSPKSIIFSPMIVSAKAPVPPNMESLPSPPSILSASVPPSIVSFPS